MTTQLRVVIDGRALVGRRTGIGVHTAEIARRLPFDPAPLIAAHTEIEDRKGIEACRFSASGPGPGVLWQQLVLPRIARREGDVLWGPHGTLPLSAGVPGVISMHDLTSITMPLAHRLKTVLSFNSFIGASLRQASAIACVSRVTADEVMRGFGIEASRIHIVYNGVDSFWSEPDADPKLPFDLQPERYVLFVGTIEPRKGVDVLVRAWHELSVPRPRLVICGSEGWGVRSTFRLIERSAQRGEIIVTGYLERAVVRALLRHCAAFVYPSLHEGFGMPPLEAMAAGAPVIVSDGGALPEIAGAGAITVPKGDPMTLARAMRRVLGEPSLRSELRRKGARHAAGFDWDEPARRMADLLESAARNRR